MEDRLMQQLKKGVLEMLVLEIICQKPTYGYELMASLKTRSSDLFTLKEGTLYPILYRLEDDGMITATWSQGAGKTTPKKMYTATEKACRNDIGASVYGIRFIKRSTVSMRRNGKWKRKCKNICVLSAAD